MNITIQGTSGTAMSTASTGMEEVPDIAAPTAVAVDTVAVATANASAGCSAMAIFA